MLRHLTKVGNHLISERDIIRIKLIEELESDDIDQIEIYFRGTSKPLVLTESRDVSLVIKEINRE